MEPGAAGSFPAEAIDETRDAIDEAEEKGPTTGSATTGGGRPGRIHGPTLLRALLTAQPQIHLFAIDGGGLTLTPTPTPQAQPPTPDPQPPTPNSQPPTLTLTLTTDPEPAQVAG